MNKSKLWTKDFIILSFANFFVALVFYLLMTTMAVYAVEQFQAPENKAGLAASIFVIGALCSRLLAGKYIEIIGRKKLLYISLIVFLVATLLYFLVDHLNVLILIRFIHGTAFGVAATVMPTAVMDMIPSERRGEGTSYFSLSPTVATAIGPFLGLIILQYADYHMIFIACTIFAVVTIMISLFVKIPEAELTKEQEQTMKKGLRFQDFFEIHALPISVIMILMGISFSGIVSFINSYAIEINLVESASFFFIVYAIVLFISRLFTGKILDVKGDNFVIYPALVLFSISFILLSQAEHGITLLLSGVFVALGFGTIMSCAQAIAVKVSPKHRVGLATSTFFICMDGGMGIGPLLTGSIVPFIGYRGMYLTLAFLVFFSIGLYYFLHGRKVSSQKEHAKAV